MLDILQRVQQQQDVDTQGSSGESDGSGDEGGACELSEQTLAKLLLRVRRHF